MSQLASTAPAVLTIAGAGLLTAAIVQLTKTMVTAPFTSGKLTISASAKTNLVQVYVYLVAAAVVLVDAWFTYHLNSRTDVLNDLSVAVAVAGIAIGSYHVLTSDAVPVLPLPAVSLSTSPATPSPVEPPPPKVKGKAVPGSANSVLSVPVATQTE